MSALATTLATARLTGGLVERNRFPLPADAAAAHDVQEQAAILLGPPSDAWKVGSTSPQARTALGTEGPGAARVPRRYRFASGETIGVFEAHDLAVEAEFALRLGRDIVCDGSPPQRDEVIAAIDAVMPALEIVGCRIAGGLAGAGRHLVTADGGANVALATGTPVTAWRCFDLPAHPVRLIRNGTPVAEGTGERALGDPVAVVVWLLRDRGRLAAGEVVSTGTCTGLVPVGPGDTLTGDFGEIGSVEIGLRHAEPG